MGSPAGNWFQWLSHELKNIGVTSYVPTLPTPENQSLSSWTAALHEQCPPITDQTVLIGHSCGAVLCMRLLEKLSTPVKCTVLVAPPLGLIGMPEIDALNTTFLDHPFDWRAIRRNAGELAYFMADNDQYVPQAQLLAIAKALEVTPIMIPHGGHLNAETGYTTFPELLSLLTKALHGSGITTQSSSREKE